MTLSTFDFGGQGVRVVLRSEEPWFVAVDVCRALELANSRDAIGRLDPDGVGSADVIDSMGRPQVARVVNEAGLYELIFQSRVPKAVAFRRWVTSEVLPTIRKTGSYGVDPVKALADPATLRQLLLENVEKVLALQGEVAAAKPKVEVYDRLVETGDTVGFREACKLIRASTGATEPEVRAFMIFRRWIQRLNGRLAPASYGETQGYVTVRDREVTMADGGTIVVPELRITQRGVIRAIERLNEGKAA